MVEGGPGLLPHTFPPTAIEPAKSFLEEEHLGPPAFSMHVEGRPRKHFLAVTLAVTLAQVVCLRVTVLPVLLSLHFLALLVLNVQPARNACHVHGMTT